MRFVYRSTYALSNLCTRVYLRSNQPDPDRREPIYAAHFAPVLFPVKFDTMSFTVTLPDGYVLADIFFSMVFTILFSFEYVGVALLSSAYLLVYQALTVGKYRKRAGVDYPQGISFFQRQFVKS